MAKIFGNMVGILFILTTPLFFIQSLVKVPDSESGQKMNCQQSGSKGGNKNHEECQSHKQVKRKTDPRYVR